MHSIERRALDAAEIESFHRKAREVMNRDAINPGDFINVYGEEEVMHDIAYVERMEELFEKEGMGEREKIAQTLEAIIYEQGELNEWFGERARTILPSRYDDIKNGVDSLIEFQETTEDEASYLALAVDVTFSGNEISQKIERILGEIKEGRLTRVKYLDSAADVRMPRVIVGVDRSAVMELAEKWVGRKNRDLASHPVQLIILDEVAAQLAAYRAYAEKLKQEELVQSFDHSIAIIEHIVGSKKHLVQERADELTDLKISDGVYRSIMSNIEHVSEWVAKEEI